MVHIYNGILLSHKKSEIIPSEATWMDLEIIILSEVSQSQITDYITDMWNFLKRYKWTYIQNRNRATDIEYKLMVTKGEGGGRDKLGG